MAFDDEDLGTIFPTRDGAIIGAGNERVMLQKVGGASGIHKAFRRNADGSVTMLVTRDGMPEFTQAVHGVSSEVEPKTYMTSGAYVFGPRGGIDYQHPELSIEPVTRKAGAVTSAENGLLPMYWQLPPIDGEVSKIYNNKKMPNGGFSDPKKVMYALPPSVFSGLMRRWVQARYGIGEILPMSGPMRVDEDLLVKLENTDKRTTGVVRFGTKYFLVAIEKQWEWSNGSSAGTSYQPRVAAYPLVFPRFFQKKLEEKNGSDAAFETLALAHAIAYKQSGFHVCWIDDWSGSTLAYGWNFSLTTNTAVIVERVTLDAVKDLHVWTYHELKFAYSNTLSCTETSKKATKCQLLGYKSPIWLGSSSGAGCINNLVPRYVEEDQDAAVYAYFVEDQLHVVHWKSAPNEYSGAFDQAKWDEDYTTSGWQGSAQFFGQGSARIEMHQDYGRSNNHGFYIAGKTSITPTPEARTEIDHKLDLAYRDGVTDLPAVANSYIWPDQYKGGGLQFWYNTGNYQGTSYNPWTRGGTTFPLSPAIPYPVPLTKYSNTIVTKAWGTLEYNNIAKTYAKASCLIIPAMDCSAVYVGEHIHTATQESKHFVHKRADHARVDEYEVECTVVGASVISKWLRYVGTVTRQFNFLKISDVELYNVEDPVNTTTKTEDDYYALNYFGAISTFASSNQNLAFYNPMSWQGEAPGPVTSISSSLFGSCRFTSGRKMDEVTSTDGYPKDITLFIGAA